MMIDMMRMSPVICVMADDVLAEAEMVLVMMEFMPCGMSCYGGHCDDDNVANDGK